MRKFLIGFISLGVVLVIFLLYNFVGKTPSTDSVDEAEYINTVIDSNIAGTDSDIGKIGELGVGTIRKAVYTTLNKNKEVEREWGFERLLHQAKEIWEIEKPFMNIYEQDFKCYITADKGEVKIETVAEKPTPKDAIFTGNVVVHIIPNQSSDIKESHIYLDDIAFISERSQLVTAGPVRFVSEDAQMFGTGLELVYNNQLERLELFRIVRLESLRIKSSQMAFLSSITEPAEDTDTAKTTSRNKSQDNVVAAATKNPEQQQAEISPQDAPSQASLAQTEQNDGDYYRCIFNKNVVIDTPEQVIFAGDSLSISNLFWSKISTKKSDTTTTETTKDVNAPIIETDKPDMHASAGANADANFPAAQFIDINSIIGKPASTTKVTASPKNEPNQADQEFVNIVVTCDDGVVLIPKDYPWSNNQSAAQTSNSIIEKIKAEDNGKGRILFIAKTIDYSATTGDVVTEGLTELTLYTNNTTDTENDRTLVPVTITAQKGAKFLQEQSKVIFEGDCLCTMPQSGLSEQRDAKLSARIITVNVPKDEKRNVLVSSDVIATGPVNLEFFAQDSRVLTDPNDPNITTTIPTVVPVKVSAREQAKFIPASNMVIFEGDCVCSMPQKGLTPSKDCTFTSPQLTIILSKEDSEMSSVVPDISAAGPAEFAFYLKDLAGTDINEAPLPAKVTAQNRASFSAETNKIIFEGNCIGTTVQQSQSSSQEYTFSAPKLTLDLHKESNNQSSELTAGIKHLKADGGIVWLRAIKTANTKSTSTVPGGQETVKGALLAGMELKCNQFDYDPNSRLLMATGPGMIKIDNSKIAEPKGNVGRFSLRQPSYGFLRNFDTLKYYIDKNKIIADARPPGLLINYFPVVNGKYDDEIVATTSHVEAYLSETDEGKVELSTLTASGSIELWDVNKRNHFIGSRLFYDHKKSMIKVTGDASQPCNCNGALVDEIIYDLATGVIEAQVVAPGAL